MYKDAPSHKKTPRVPDPFPLVVAPDTSSFQQMPAICMSQAQLLEAEFLGS